VGLGAGGWIGGQLSQNFGWRMSLVAVGLPGLLLALIVWLFAAEPRRTAQARTAPRDRGTPLREVAGMLFASTSMRWTALAIVSVSMAGFPFIIWAGSFYQTVHGMSVRDAGAALFWPITGGLVVGNVLAGWLADRFGKGRPAYLAGVAVIGLLLAFPFGLWMAQAPDARWSLVAFFWFKLLITLHLGPLMALCFAQVPAGMRAMLGASISTVITLCGVGVGTFLVGALSTYFATNFGELSLRYALSAVCFTLLPGAAAAFMAGRTARPLEAAA
jgi:predicted MFS family arabinose efflux permease